MAYLCPLGMGPTPLDSGFGRLFLMIGINPLESATKIPAQTVQGIASPGGVWHLCRAFQYNELSIFRVELSSKKDMNVSA